MIKRSKPLHNLLLTAALVGSTVPFATLAHAQDAVSSAATAATIASMTVTKDQAEKTVRDLLQLSADKWNLTSTEAHTGQDVNNMAGISVFWQLTFSPSDKKSYAGITVMVDGTTGKLIDVTHYDKTNSMHGNLTRDEAKQLAMQFLQKAVGDELKSTVENKTPTNNYGPSGDYYTFEYDRVVNNATVIGDQFSITIASDGTLVRYTRHWTPAEFPAIGTTVDEQTANQAYAASLAMRLQYVEAYGATPSVKLVYNPSYVNNSIYNPSKYPYGFPQVFPMIDAKTGKLLNPDGTENTSPNAPAVEPLVKDGPTAPTTRTQPLTQDEANAVVAGWHLVPDGAKLIDSTYSDAQAKTYNFHYQIQAGSTATRDINFSLNALTGELVNYNSWDSKGQVTTGTPQFTHDQLQEKATALIKQLFPDRTGALALGYRPNIAIDSTSLSSMVNFTLLKNGVPTQQAIDVSFDVKTGELVNLYTPFLNAMNTQFDYPTPDDAVGADKAKDVLMQNRPLHLSYVFPITQDGISTTPLLVYAPAPTSTPSVVDAKTGTWTTMYPWEQPQQPATLPTDIKGHWAEKVLTRFAQNGWLELEDGKANPDRHMTRGALVHLLVKTHGGPSNPNTDPQAFTDVKKGDKYYDDVQTALDRHWIAKSDTFRPNDLVSRQEAAAIFVRMQGLSELATHKEIFHLPYADETNVADWAYGSVAISTGLGLMRGSDNQFRPTATITLAEAVTIIAKQSDLVQGPQMYK